MRIVLTGGGSGGHLMPLMAVKKKIEEENPGVEFMFIGPNGKLEEEIIEKEGVRARKIMTGKFRRYFSLMNLVDFFKIHIGVIQSLFWLLVFMPDGVFSKGGYASFPVVLAAWLYRIPTLIHDSDSRPGLANAILGKLATRVAVSYPEAEKEFPSGKVVLTGNPVREDIAKGEAQRARELFGIKNDKKVLFIWGGSQGSGIINDKVLNLLPELVLRYNLIHQTGEKNIEDSKRKAGELGIKAGHDGYYPVAFIGKELKDILALADLIISRAGANSIAEIAANGKPSILIPIQNSANNHQEMNAYEVEKAGGCVTLEENNLGENLLRSRIDDIMNSPELQRSLGENVRSFYNPEAAGKIADGLMDLIQK